MMSVYLMLFALIATAQPKQPLAPASATSDQSNGRDIEAVDFGTPFNPDNSNDVQFLNQLLLTHGLELPLLSNGKLGEDQYNSLIESISQGGYQQALTDGLISDISDSVFISFWSGTEEVQPRDDLVALDEVVWKTLWWELNTSGAADRSAHRQPVAINTSRSFRQRGLKVQAMNSLIERLAGEGYQLTVDELCDPANRVDAAIGTWLSKGEIPQNLTEMTRREYDATDPAGVVVNSSAWAKVFEEGVSRQWQIVWLECSDGLFLVRVPPTAVHEMPDTHPAGRIFPNDRSGRDSSPGDGQALPRPSESQMSAERRQDDEAIDEADSGFSVSAPDTVAPESLQPPKASPFDDSRVRISDDVPAGFEALAGPQFVYIDVYFNDVLLGSTGITATPEDFTFDDPVEVSQWLEEEVKSEELIVWLSEPLATNGHLACYAQDDPPGCGQIDADPVAAIYNEMLLRVDLFIAADKQSLKFREVQRHLPDPQSDNTAIVSVYALGSELAGEAGSFDVSARALYGYGRGHVTAEADYNDRQKRKRLHEFKLTHYLDDHELVAGTYAFHPGGALTDVNLVGVDFGTSFKTRVDLEHAFSSQLVVFLSTRSVVQLIIDGRVYSGDSYAAGNQVLNTADLPDGTYEVELRIFDQGGTFRSEQRVFTKSTRIPPKGEAIYALTAGRVVQPDAEGAFPELSDTSVLGVNRSGRLNDQSAWRVGLLQFGSHLLAQGEYLYLGKRMSFQAAGSIGQSDTVAASFQTGFAIRSTSFSLAGRHFSSSVDGSGNAVEAAFFVDDYDQLSLSANRAFGQIAVGARSSLRREQSATQEQSTVSQYGIFAQKPVYRRANSRGLISTSLLRTPDTTRIELKFDWFFDINQFNGSLGLLSVDTRPDSREWQGDASLGWHSSSQRTTQVKSGAYATMAESSNAYGVRTELKHPWFLATAASDVSETEEAGTLQNSVVSVSAHLGVDRRGVGMGGSDFAQAGVIVDVDGDPDGELFDIMINNSRVSTGSIGTVQFIGLQPFRTYEVRFVPHSLLGFGIADDSFTFTVFPGTVHRVGVQAQREVLLIATLVDTDGNPLVDALLKTDRNALLVDRDGVLQAEVHSGAELTVRKKDGSTCSILIPYSTEDILVPDEPVVCR